MYRQNLYLQFRRYRLYYIVGGVLFCTLCLGILLFVPPRSDVHYPQVFVVSEGKTIREIAHELHDQQIIVSPTLFIVANYLFGGKILWGSYHLYEPRNTFFLAREMYYGNKNMPLRRVTVPEESNLYALARSL